MGQRSLVPSRAFDVVRSSQSVGEIGRAAQIGKPTRQICQLLDDDVDNQPFALDLALGAQQFGAEEHRAIAREDIGPDHEVDHPGLILKSDENDAFGCSRPLPDQDQAGDPSPIIGAKIAARA